MNVHGGKIRQCIRIAVLGLLWAASPAWASGSAVESDLKRAFFAQEQASRDVRHIADWVVDSGDNQGLAFVIIDKPNARVFVFDARGRIQGAAPVLLGLGIGDHSAPGIGEREFSKIPPKDRTTPAGRFVARAGRNFHGVDIIWVDYDTAVSMHRVVTGSPAERRLHRLATPTIADNRVSYGCINVPVNFYNSVVSPAFSGTSGIVYILPETRPARDLFMSYDVEERARQRIAERAALAALAQVADPAGELWY